MKVLDIVLVQSEHSCKETFETINLFQSSKKIELMKCLVLVGLDLRNANVEPC